MKQHQVITACIVYMCILFSGCRNAEQDKPSLRMQQKTVRNVTVFTVKPDSFVVYGSYSGCFVPQQEAHLVCYGGGRVDAVYVNEGAVVKAGASLAAIDSTKAKTVLRTAKLQETLAFRNFEQAKKHLAEGNASQLSVDQAELAYYTAKSAFIDAKKLCTGALAIAPLSGTVISRSIRMYQELPPNAPTFTIAQTTVLKVLVAIAESEVSFITPGISAAITSPLDPKRSWPGTIKSIAREASPETHTFTTEIQVENSDGMLKPGATANARITLMQLANVLVVPARSIQSDGSGPSVMVVSADNRVRRVAVTCGVTSDSMTLVEKGVVAGDRIIVAGNGIRDGDVVAIDR